MMVPAINSLAPRLCYVNTAPSSIITNTTAETAFDQIFTFPSQSQRSTQPTSVLRFKAFGLMSTGILNLGFMMRLRWGGVGGTVICATDSLTLASSLSADGWTAECVCMIQSNGASATVEGQGFCSFESGLGSVLGANMPNAVAFNLNLNTQNDIVLTAQWSSASASNQIQLRTCTVEMDGP